LYAKENKAVRISGVYLNIQGQQSPLASEIEQLWCPREVVIPRLFIFYVYNGEKLPHVLYTLT